MKTIISAKGQIVLPAKLRKQDRIQAGQEFEIERLEAGQYLLQKCIVPRNQGLLDWLLDCPEKDWFEPLSSDSTLTP